MEYNFYHYSQLGDYYCPGCGFKRPSLEFDGTNVDLNDGIAFDVNGFHIKANYRGFYNVYNILAVYGAASWQVFLWNISMKFWEITSHSSEEMNCFRYPAQKLC